jgi:hypothetical protein
METLNELRKLENEARQRLLSAEREYLAAKAMLAMATIRLHNHESYVPPRPQPFINGRHIYGLPKDLRPAKAIRARQSCMSQIDLADFK